MDYASFNSELEEYGRKVFEPFYNMVLECNDFSSKKLVKLLKLHKELYYSSLPQKESLNEIIRICKYWLHKIQSKIVYNRTREIRKLLAESTLGKLENEINQICLGFNGEDFTASDLNYNNINLDIISNKKDRDVQLNSDNLLQNHRSYNLLAFERADETCWSPIILSMNDNQGTSKVEASYNSLAFVPYTEEKWGISLLFSRIEETLQDYRQEVTAKKLAFPEDEDEFFAMYHRKLVIAANKAVRRIVHMEQLERKLNLHDGDHICVRTPQSFLSSWHHGIYNCGKVIEVKRNSTGYCIQEVPFTIFCRGLLPSKTTVLRKFYKECFSPVDVVKLARSRIGAFSNLYPKYTSKNFATQCKMGFKIENTTPKKVGIVFTGITTSTALGVTTSVLLETSSAIAASAIVGGAAAGGMVLGAALAFGVAAGASFILRNYFNAHLGSGEYRLCLKYEKYVNSNARIADKDEIIYFEMKELLDVNSIAILWNLLSTENLLILSFNLNGSAKYLTVQSLRSTLQINDDLVLYLYDHSSKLFQEINKNDDMNLPQACSLRIKHSCLQFAE